MSQKNESFTCISSGCSCKGAGKECVKRRQYAGLSVCDFNSRVEKKAERPVDDFFSDGKNRRKKGDAYVE